MHLKRQISMLFIDIKDSVFCIRRGTYTGDKPHKTKEQTMKCLITPRNTGDKPHRTAKYRRETTQSEMFNNATKHWR